MPDFPKPPGGGVTAEEVWTHGDRQLTELIGTPRSDLLGEDESFEAGSGSRKSSIDRLANIEAFDAPIEGSLTADGAEQNVVLDETVGNPSRYLEGFIDLTNMAGGDTVVIREYISVIAGPSYRKYAEETYSGVQALPLLFITTKPARYGLRVTLQQTAGTYKAYPYQFWRKRVA